MRIPRMEKFNFEDYDKRQYEVRDLGKATTLAPIHINLENMNTKAKDRFITNIKNMIRGSLEYTIFISFLKNELDMNECTFFNQINTKKRNIKIEMHHEPFTLTDLINVAIKYFEDNDVEINDFDISEFVMLWHYTGLVGVIPLSKTVHELYHDGSIFIPLTFPFGNIIGFYNEYKDYMTNTLRTKFKKLVEKTKEYDSKPPEILRKRFVYLKVDGFELPKSI